MSHQLPSVPLRRLLGQSDSVSDGMFQRYVSQRRGVRNPTAAHPVLFKFDNSGSTNSNGACREINAFQVRVSEELKLDRRIAPSVLVATATFGRSTAFEVRIPFTPADELDLKPVVANCGTPHCESMVMAVEFVAKARQILATEFCREVRRAWIFDLTDGATQDRQHNNKAVSASKVTALQEGIHIFYFGVGDNCDMNYLRELAQPGRPPVHLKEVEDLRRFFEWLHESLHIYSCSRRGDRVELPPFDDNHPPLITEG
jgi:uncharacterized protein YegL